MKKPDVMVKVEGGVAEVTVYKPKIVVEVATSMLKARMKTMNSCGLTKTATCAGATSSSRMRR